MISYLQLQWVWKHFFLKKVINTYDEEIKDCNCFSCAASLGGCKYVIALIFWLHRRTEEPALTEVVSYWKKTSYLASDKLSSSLK